jgi:hypothetical protein
MALMPLEQVTCLTLGATVSEFAAENVLKLLPSSNGTALEIDLQVLGTTRLRNLQ